MIIISQAKLFNENLTENQINFIVNNKVMIYDNFINIKDNEIKDISETEITWEYDDNNYRIPYINGVKIQQLKLNNIDNIYNYISSSSLILDTDIICGDNFLNISDIFIGSNSSINANPYNRLMQKNIINLENNIEQIINNKQNINNIIFVKTDDLPNFYNKINNKINTKDKIIITHNSDYGINSTYTDHLNKVKKQYSQNCLISHTNLVPIPIGIENRQWFDHQIFHKVRKRTDIKKEKKIYFYFSLSTHNSRNQCYEKLKNKLQWNNKLSKKDYFIELKKHKFAICPRGNGLDTHRLWECFYLDVIPIMIKNDSVKIDNLPIIFLNDWSELDVNNLQNKFDNITFSKITLQYYINQINGSIISSS
jgi:hypothetical protein